MKGTTHFRIDEEIKRLAMQAAERHQVSLTELMRQRVEAGIDIGKSGERRKLVLTRFPFIIIYALKRKINEVHILRILHTHTSRKVSAEYPPR